MGLLSTIGAASGRAFGFTRSAIASAVDQYFNLTTLLLPGNGTNGAQNNTFLDSSSNNFTITRNGNTTQGTFSPFSQTGWSNYFNGSSYLSAPTNAAFDQSTGDFCFEAWFNQDSRGNLRPVLAQLPSQSSGAWRVSVNNGSAADAIQFVVNVGGSWTTVIDVSVTWGIGTWNHVAITRSGSTIRAFNNGTLAASATFSSAVGSSTFTPTVGYIAFDGIYFTGYISNARIVKGYPIYTAAFTPSTTPLTAVTGTSLLTCQSNRFVDNSSNALTITVNGTPSVQAFSPFYPLVAYTPQAQGGSGYFDGNGDFLQFTNSTNIFNGDFTAECWFYRLGSAGGDHNHLLGNSSNSSTGFYWAIREGGSGLAFQVYLNAAIITYTFTNSQIPIGAWTYLAIVKSGSTITGYINGVSIASGTVSDATTGIGTTYLVGRGATSGGWSTQYVNGYLSSYRLSTTARTIAVPTAPLTAITNTSTLLNFTNAGIVDSTAKNVLETVSSVQVSTTQSKFGGSSMWFQAGGTLAMANSPNLSFGTGDFTVEWWIYWNTLPTASVGFVSGSGSGSTDIRYDGTNLQIGRYLVALDSSFAWTAVTGQWYHVAMTRQGTSIRAFVNGTQIGTTSTNSNTYNAIGNFYVGTVTFGTAGDTPLAYIDDFRITKGYARYTANFTPPTAAFPVQ